MLPDICKNISLSFYEDFVIASKKSSLLIFIIVEYPMLFAPKIYFYPEKN